MVDCIGSIVSVDCGSLGYYQGKLSAVDSDTRDITLVTAFRDGIPMGRSVTLNVEQIEGIKILKSAESTPQQVPENAKAKTPPKKQTPNNTPKKPVQSLQRSKSTSSASTGANQSTAWVPRPFHHQVPKKSDHKPQAESSTSSDTAENSQSPVVEMGASKKRNNKKAKSRSRTRKETSNSSSSDPAVVEFTPTPMFRRFEPQIPVPQSLSPPQWALKNSKKGKGPCGIPILDIHNGYGRISQHNSELNRPIDFGQLQEDFDFDSNLALFEKESKEADDEQFYENVEKPKMSKNFQHYENILDDPTRITSWTKQTAKYATTSTCDEEGSVSTECDESSSLSTPSNFAFSPSDIVTGPTGIRVPVLDKVIKAKYIKEGINYMGERVFQYMLVDRLISYILRVASRFNIDLSKLAILSSKSQSDSSTKINKILMVQLENRGIKSFCFPNKASATIPTESFKMVLLMDTNLTESMKAWLSSQNTTQLVCYECLPTDLVDYSKVHVLTIGTLTSDTYQTSVAQPVLGKTTFAALCGMVKRECFVDCCVVDLGIPFNWITGGGAEILTSTFSRTNSVDVFPN